MSTAYVSTRQPTLEWRLAAGETAARVELARDPSFARVAIVRDVTGTTTRPETALDPGVWFWRVRPVGERGAATDALVWEFSVPRRSTAVDTTTGLFIDVNRDGLADLLIGSWPGVYVGGRVSGSCEVRLGSRAGPTAAVYQFVETGPDVEGAVHLSYLGDVNGDGFGDVMVVRHQGQPTRVLLGSESSLHDAPAGTSATGAAWLLAAGDLDRDGYGDTVSWGYAAPECDVFHGGPGGLVCAASWPDLDRHGSPPPSRDTVVSPGDLDGDGASDLIASYTDDAVYGWRGVRGAPPVAIGPLPVGTPPRAPVYGRLVGPGDINGDGRADFVLHGIPFTSPLVVGFGQAVGPAVRVVNVPGDPDAALPHRYAGRAGDLDGDGFADVAYFPMRSVVPADVLIFRGDATGLSTGRTWSLRAADTDIRHASTYGFSVGGVGDLDGDGFDDLAVGQPDTDGAGGGAVYVYRGGPAGPASRPAWTFRGGRGYGASVTSPEQQSWY